MHSGQSNFYFATIRKVSVAFGSLFNNIHVQRFDDVGGQGNVTNTIKVPLSYAAGQKWYIQKRFDQEAGKTIQTRISLPRIGFELTGIQYDPQRKVQTMGFNQGFDENDASSFFKQLNPVPFDLSYNVYIAIKNVDDGLQIIEQILPYFTPSYNLSIKEIPELSIVRDVPVIFQGSVDLQDDYQGNFDTQRVLIYTLSFVAKSYLYPPINDENLIKKVFVNYYKDKEMEEKQNVTTVKVNPIDSQFNEDWESDTTHYSEEQFDSNGQPIEV